MPNDSKAVTVRFNIEIPKGYKYEGISYTISCDFGMEFTKKEILLVKRFLAAYEHDADTDLMPILEENLPEMYQRIDKKARETLTEFFWQEAIIRTEGAPTFGELLQLNYKRDVESGEFVPSKEYKPQFHYDEGVDLAYTEWFERELMCKTDEARQRFHERYDENFDGMDVCGDEYVCHIPDAFLPKEELDCVKCQYNLGVMYNDGLDVPVDYDKARKWYTRAAEQGFADAQNNLGCMYVKGEGVPVDYVAARRWFTKAAEQGLAESQYNLGKMYHLGKGVSVDFETARKWYNKALEQGYEKAKEGLSRLRELN